MGIFLKRNSIGLANLSKKTNIENEQKNLQKCFEQNIQLVQNVIDEIKFKTQSANDIFMTADPWEERLIMDFKCDFERKIIEQKSTFYADYYF